MRRLSIVAAVLIGICIFFSGPAWAEDNLIRFGLGYFVVTGDFSDDPVDLDNGIGFFLDYERNINDKWGVDFRYDAAVFELGLFGNDDVDMYSLTARANYYIARNDRTHFFVHPTIGMINLDNRGDSESGLALGAGAGVDVKLGKSKWVFSGDIGYITADILDQDFNNIAMHAGVGRRF